MKSFDIVAKLLATEFAAVDWCDSCATPRSPRCPMGIGQGLCIHLSMKTGKKQSSCSELSLRKILEDPGRFENAWDKVEMDFTSPCLPHSDHIQVLYDQWFFNASVILMACVTFPTRSVIIVTQFYRFAGLLKGFRTNKPIAWLS